MEKWINSSWDSFGKKQPTFSLLKKKKVSNRISLNDQMKPIKLNEFVILIVYFIF